MKFYLYKYFNLDGSVATDKGDESRLNIFKKILLNEKIYVPSLDQLNDPYEKVLTNLTFVKSLVEMKTLANEPGILSFTSNPLNLLMWSHYGMAHTGVVIKFLVEESELKEFGKVIYVQNKDEVFLHNKQLVKSHHWNYENEYRRIFSKNKMKVNLNTLGLSIDGVIFGANCSESNFKNVEKVCIAKDFKFGKIRLTDNFECEIRDYRKFSHCKLDEIRSRGLQRGFDPHNDPQEMKRIKEYKDELTKMNQEIDDAIMNSEEYQDEVVNYSNEILKELLNDPDLKE